MVADTPGPERRTGRTVLGWIASSSNLRYLQWIEPALARVLRNRPDVTLRIVADGRPCLSSLPTEQVDYVPWSPLIEADAVRGFDIGLMPLLNGEWERGKCSFKMLLYMACGIPVVASPVGMNAEVLSRGEVGLGATTIDEWVECLDSLVASPDECRRMGAIGRSIALQHFSIEVLAPEMAALLRSVT